MPSLRLQRAIEYGLDFRGSQIWTREGQLVRAVVRESSRPFPPAAALGKLEPGGRTHAREGTRGRGPSHRITPRGLNQRERGAGGRSVVPARPAHHAHTV